jgi:hypothetical protein
MTTQDRKYPHLGANFLKGSVAGKSNRSIAPERRSQRNSLAECGIVLK